MIGYDISDGSSACSYFIADGGVTSNYFPIYTYPGVAFLENGVQLFTDMALTATISDGYYARDGKVWRVDAALYGPGYIREETTC